MVEQLRTKTEGDIAALMKESLEKKGQAASGAAAVTNTDDDDDDESLRPITNPKTGEIGGPKGPEPTRFNDWERGGRCSDF